MSRKYLILGGARSGKSALAERLVQETGLARVYIATAQALDDEMADRIGHHQQRRGTGWRTVEAPLALPQAVSDAAKPGHVVLVDCLTLWLSNLMLEGRTVETEMESLAAALKTASGPVVLVSNEVGLSIVPDNALARAFRDHSGRMNQMIAASADEVYFVAAGLPLKLKG